MCVCPSFHPDIEDLKQKLRQQIEEEKNPFLFEDKVFDSSVEDLIRAGNNLAIWHLLNNDEKVEIYGKLVNKISIRDGKVVSVVFNPWEPFMYLQNKLLAKKHCYELAMQAALEEWQRDPVEFKCPACGSKNIGSRPGLRGKNPCLCFICKHHFDQPAHFVCDCVEPGSQSKCHDCPNFHKLMVLVKASAKDSQFPNLEEISN